MSNQFFDVVRRSELFGASLTQGQVDGLESLLRACEGFPRGYTAHVMAEVYRETGGGMLPVKETVFPYHKDKNPSDAEVIRRLDVAWNKGQLPWVKKPYWRGGMFGRGQIQLTHEYNYRDLSSVVGVDLVARPWKALELPISAKIAAEGCRLGKFTGKKLSDYMGPNGKFDHYNARDCVNGDKNKRDNNKGPTVGTQIAQAASVFESALSSMPASPEIPQERPGVGPRITTFVVIAAIVVIAFIIWKVIL